MSPKRLCYPLLVLFILLLGTPYIASYPAPSAAAVEPGSDMQQENTRATPPPIGRGCSRGATPIDYAEPACCMSGYVYLNGAPIAGAEVTISIGSRTVQTTTRTDSSSALPYFFASLDSPPLNASPGDTLVVTATAYGQSKTVSFTVKEGGQQIDVVLPQMALNATWVTGDTAMPTLREAAMAYDASNERVVLFGGYTEQDRSQTYLADTWTWDGRSWMPQASPTSPSARANHAMAYDAARERVILFGGTDDSGAPLTDTWEWDGNDWVQRPEGDAPAISAHPAMVYDAAREQLLLVGVDAADETMLATWAWDGNTWTQLSPAVNPPARAGYDLAYDTQRERVVLFGGIQNDTRLNDTWEWDGITWTRKFPVAEPPKRNGHAMTYDATRQQVLLTGGIDNSGEPQADTWAWDGTNWLTTTLHTPARAGALFTYDTARQFAVLYGGYTNESASDYPNETWELDAIDWSQRAPRVSPEARQYPAMAYDPERKRVVLFSGSSGTSSNDTWEWDGNTWTQRFPEVSPPGRNDHIMVYDVAQRQVIVFGGQIAGLGCVNDTWAWDGENWTELNPSNSPPARCHHSMVYDTARKRIVLFGGMTYADADQGSTHFRDTWEWDGNTWIERHPNISPPEYSQPKMSYDTYREKTVLALLSQTWEWDGDTWAEQSAHTPGFSSSKLELSYDEVQQHVIAFGGWDTSPPGRYLQDMWQWDDTSWVQFDPPIIPPGRNRYEMTVDTERQRIVLFGGYANGYLDDTWEWNGETWIEQPDDSNVPDQLSNAAMSYEQREYSLLFGGRAPDGSLSSRTFRWQGNQWIQQATANTPPARQGHSLMRNRDGSNLLLFGGTDADGAYLDDTWLWQGSEWIEQTPPTSPAARASYSLAYDSQREHWLLFGGQNSTGYLNDTWVYSNTAWMRLDPTTSPPPRAGATLTYDATRGRAVLIGGRNVDGLRDDVWEWDGTTWVEVSPAQRLSPRTGHGAVYDTSRGVVVVSGGLEAAGSVGDTWEWNGEFWRERITAAPLPSRYRMAIAYDAYRGEIVVFGGEDSSGTILGDTFIHQASGSLSEPVPVATINRVTPRDVRQEVDTITFEGSGADTDETDVITAYRWMHEGQILSNDPTFTLPASDLPVGEQTIRFEVQDNEGNWSAPVRQTVFVRTPEGSLEEQATWTLLIYADADNDLDWKMGDYADSNGMLYRLRSAGAQAGVQVAMLYDGPRTNDTHRYTLNAAGEWTDEPVPEARMDEMATLRDFIIWGRSSFQSDHYALSIVDHANGVVGIARDSTTDPTGRAFLTPIEVRTALQEATNGGERKIDVLHYDGCSFGLFENAAIAEGQANFIVASPNTGWGVFAYEQYRANAARIDEPRAYALAVAETYADNVMAYDLAYTISVFDMARFDTVHTRISAFGDSLLAYVQGDSSRVNELKEIRNAAQKYDSGGVFLEIDDEDAYVDLIDLAERVRTQINDVSLTAAATAVIEAVEGTATAGREPFVIYASHRSAQFNATDPGSGQDRLFTVNLDKAHGLGVYYPPRSTTAITSTYITYVQHRLFDVTRDSGWTRFLANGLPPQLGSDPPPLPNDVLIPPLIPPEIHAGNQRVFLPLVTR